jgi:sugar-phosphatase
MTASSRAVRRICFDLDGVLVDSTAVVENVWRDWAERHGINPALVRDVHGRRTGDVVEDVAPWLDAEAEGGTIEADELARVGENVPAPGASELLSLLPLGSWAIVTSGPRALAAARLEAAGLTAPDYLVSADDVRLGKPSPQPYLQVARLLGVTPGECLAVEDSPAGIDSANAAGMRVVGVTGTHHADRLKGADKVIDSLEELKPVAYALTR